jgi:hypothetical protein
MSRKKQQIEKQVKEQNEKERLESNAIELHGVVHETDLKLNGGEIEDSYFKWLEDNNLSFGGGLDYIDCTKDDVKENVKPVEAPKASPLLPFINIAITYFTLGLAISDIEKAGLLFIAVLLCVINATVSAIVWLKNSNK